MEKYILSKQVREYLKEINYQFTDSQKATLIWKAENLSKQERNTLLKEIAYTTDDKKLKDNIEYVLSAEDREYKQFCNNKNDNYVFAIEQDLRILPKVFKNGEHAIEFAKNRAIEKKRECYIEKMEVYELTDAQNSVSSDSARIDTDGEIWISSNYGILNRYKSYQRDFRNAFVHIPYPEFFEKGIIAKNLLTNHYCVIGTSLKEWNEFCERIVNGLDASYRDMAITVYSLLENGTWSQLNVNPIYLEVAYPEEYNPHTRALDALSSYFSHDCGCDEEQRVLQACKEYALNSDRYGRVFKATRFDDIKS